MSQEALLGSSQGLVGDRQAAPQVQQFVAEVEAGDAIVPAAAGLLRQHRIEPRQLQQAIGHAAAEPVLRTDQGHAGQARQVSQCCLEQTTAVPNRVAQPDQAKRQHREAHAKQHGNRLVEEQPDIETHDVLRRAEHDEMQAEGGSRGCQRRLGHPQGAEEQRYAQGQAKHGETTELGQQQLADDERHRQRIEDAAQEHHADLLGILAAGEQAADHAGQGQGADRRGPGSSQPEG
ncbi:hypothetical protein D9M70_477880 [compost metagenome]